MDKQAIEELEWEARREDAAQRPRTKEDLILTQRHIVAETYYNAAACAFVAGEFEKARFLIVDAAGREWEQDFLRGFDLRLVGEQGAMLCDGSVPMRVCGPAAVFRWTAGEMFADVAARGAAMVRDAVKEHLAPKVHKEISGTMATQWAPSATGTNYCISGASSIRGVLPMHWDDNGAATAPQGFTIDKLTGKS